MSDERNTATFQIVGFDEGKVMENETNGVHRLVCNIKGGEKIAIWGKDSMDNINAVWNAGIPCTVECDTTPPNEWGKQRYDHTHWVPEDSYLRVL